jgi:hypothetical protein
MEAGPALERFQEKCGRFSVRNRDKTKKLEHFGDSTKNENAPAPPAAIEHVVQWLIPPKAREAVVGDLREIYSTPSQYVAEAAKTVPQVFASCVLRALNPALLLLQFLLLLFILETIHAQFHQLTQTAILRISAVVLSAIVLRDTYQQDGRPEARSGILESILVALFLMAFCQDAFGLKEPQLGTPDFNLQFQFFVVLPLAVPLLGVIRTMLIVWGDEDLDRFIDSIECGTIAEDPFSRRLRRRELAEAWALVCGGGLLASLPGTFVWLAAVYLATAVLMLAANWTAKTAKAVPGVSLIEYRRLLGERQQMRQLLIWVWASPVLIAIYRWLIAAGFSDKRAVLVSIGSALAILTCFFVDSLNRELAGQVREKTRMLEHQTAQRV